MIKTLKKVSIEGTYVNLIKTIYDKSVANIMVSGDMLKAFPLRSGTRQGCALLPLLFNMVLKGLAMSIREEKETKGIQIRKGEVKLSRRRLHDTIHRNPKDTTRKLLELINEFSKGTGYKINTQKSLVFLYTNNKR